MYYVYVCYVCICAHSVYIICMYVHTNFAQMKHYHIAPLHQLGYCHINITVVCMYVCMYVCMCERTIMHRESLSFFARFRTSCSPWRLHFGQIACPSSPDSLAAGRRYAGGEPSIVCRELYTYVCMIYVCMEFMYVCMG